MRIFNQWRPQGAGLPGESPSAQTHLNNAIALQAEYPRGSLPELRKDKTPKDWNLESRQVAVEKAYLHGGLKGGTDRETGVELPEAYNIVEN